MKRGFTLIEVIIVVAILGILASVIIGAVTGSRSMPENTQENGAVDTIIDMVQGNGKGIDGADYKDGVKIN